MDSDSRRNRYSRHILLDEVGAAGQMKFAESRVAVVGCGALGTVAAGLLARSGIGFIRVIDRDVVDWSNLQRQVLFTEADIGLPKADAAVRRLRELNSEIRIEPLILDLDATNVEESIRGMTLVVDGTDNIRTRLRLNDACVKNRIPWVYAGVVRTGGMVMAVCPGGPCLRCLLPEPPPPASLLTCDRVGVLNSAAETVAALAFTTAVKILLGAVPPPGLLHVDVWEPSLELVAVERNPECECCGRGRFPFLQPGEEDRVTSFCGRNSVQIVPARSGSVDFDSLTADLGKVGRVCRGDDMLVFAAEDFEITVFRDGRAIIRGTEDIARAQALYARYLG